MSKSAKFEIPSESEKLPHRFILDRLRKRMLNKEYQDYGLPADASSKCGTEAAKSTAVDTPPPTIEVPVLSLPNGKEYFRVSEVAQLIKVKAHVLRFWQSEFNTLRPSKSGNGHWVYSRKDVHTLHLIRHLLYVEKYSIKGAKKRLRQKNQHPIKAPSSNETEKTIKTLKSIAKDLRELVQLVRNTPV